MDQTLLLLLEIVYSKKRKNKNIRHDQIFMEYVIILLRNRIFLSLKPKKPKNCWWTYNIAKASYSQDRSEKCSDKCASRCFAVHFAPLWSLSGENFLAENWKCWKCWEKGWACKETLEKSWENESKQTKTKKSKDFDYNNYI